MTWSLLQWTSAEFGKQPGPAWDMIIVGDQSHPVDFSQLDPAIRMNKFPTTNPLTRKDQMSNNFRAMQKKFGKKYFAFMPETFNFPADARQLKMRIKKCNNNNSPALWICKPPRGSQGNGIILAREFKVMTAIMINQAHGHIFFCISRKFPRESATR